MTRPSRREWVAAVKQSDLTSTQRLVAREYADYLADGGETWVTWKTLQANTNLSHGAVALAVKVLTSSGWLVEIEPARQHYSARYRLALPAQQSTSWTPEQSTSWTPGDSRGPSGDSRGPSGEPRGPSGGPDSKHTRSTPPPDPAAALAMVVVASIPDRLRSGADRQIIRGACEPLLGIGWDPDRLTAAIKAHGWESARHAGAVTAFLQQLATTPPAAQQHHSRPTWCGTCDEHTRLLDRGDAVQRCPACHPLQAGAA